MASSFSTAFAAPRSCQKPRRLLTRIMVKIMMAFTESPRKNDKAPAKIKMRIRGLLNWVSKRDIVFDRFLGLIRLEPYFVSLFLTSSLVKPFVVV